MSRKPNELGWSLATPLCQSRTKTPKAWRWRRPTRRCFMPQTTSEALNWVLFGTCTFSFFWSHYYSVTNCVIRKKLSGWWSCQRSSLRWRDCHGWKSQSSMVPRRTAHWAASWSLCSTREAYCLECYRAFNLKCCVYSRRGRLGILWVLLCADCWTVHMNFLLDYVASPRVLLAGRLSRSKAGKFVRRKILMIPLFVRSCRISGSLGTWGSFWSRSHRSWSWRAFWRRFREDPGRRETTMRKAIKKQKFILQITKIISFLPSKDFNKFDESCGSKYVFFPKEISRH